MNVNVSDMRGDDKIMYGSEWKTPIFFQSLWIQDSLHRLVLFSLERSCLCMDQ